MVQATTFEVPRSVVETRAYASSDAGTRRTVNEDSFLVSAPVFAVADGMGGHRRGDLASADVVDQLRHSVVPDAPTTPDTVFTAITAANARILDWASGMGVAGSTVAGVALVTLSAQADCHWMIFNIGDSRVYLLEDDELRQVTVDHSVVQELIDAGEITREEASGHPDRNYVTRAVGVERLADPDVWLIPVAERQVFVVCSDGLTSELRDADILDVLRTASADPAEELVRRALVGGARDNVTALVVDATTVDTASPRAGYHDGIGLGALEHTRPRA